jgi:glyoxylase-like metal-dependent hydrolase (beta-lactamase superfamily II)
VIVPLHASNPSAMTGSGNWTYLLPGRHPVLIDAGNGQREYLDALEHVSDAGPRHVLVTHAHTDHIAGVHAIRGRWTATRFAKFAWPERDAKYAVGWESLSDGAVIAAGDGELHVVHTPGHSPDHVAFWAPANRVLFCGDLVVPGTTVVILASQGGDMKEYLRSLERVLALGATRMFPAHGPPIEEPERILRSYVEHRRQREQQVLEGVGSGLDSIDALVERIYRGLEAALRPMARESVLAHLRKLEDDGLVRREGDRWAIY